MSRIQGSCRCGKVSYSSYAEPMFIGVCHCRNCQKETGSAFATVIGVPSPSVSVKGTTQRFDSKGDSGAATHLHFCPSCGSAVTRSVDLMTEVTMITVGTLDDTSWVKPTMQIYCDSAEAWVSLGGAIQRFPKMPS